MTSCEGWSHGVCAWGGRSRCVTVAQHDANTHMHAEARAQNSNTHKKIMTDIILDEMVIPNLRHNTHIPSPNQGPTTAVQDLPTFLHTLFFFFLAKHFFSFTSITSHTSLSLSASFILSLEPNFFYSIRVCCYHSIGFAWHKSEQGSKMGGILMVTIAQNRRRIGGQTWHTCTGR